MTEVAQTQIHGASTLSLDTLDGVNVMDGVRGLYYVISGQVFEIFSLERGEICNVGARRDLRVPRAIQTQILVASTLPLGRFDGMNVMDGVRKLYDVISGQVFGFFSREREEKSEVSAQPAGTSK